MSIRPLLVPVLVATLLSSGCIAAADDEVDAMEIDELPTEPMDTWTGQNGEWPPYWQQMLSQMPAAFQLPLADPADPGLINPAIRSLGFAETAAGREVFHYIVKCAIPPGSQNELRRTAGEAPYQGEGILVGTGTWRTQALSSTYHNRVHECLMAFLNGFDQSTPIAITSPIEVATSGDLGAFPIIEAAWVSDVVGLWPNTWRRYRAFVHPQFQERCANYLEIFKHRICSNLGQNCSVTVGTWGGNCSTDAAGTTYCSSQFAQQVPALVTRVSDAMYSSCAY